jgi:hypothetical protein
LNLRFDNETLHSLVPRRQGIISGNAIDDVSRLLEVTGSVRVVVNEISEDHPQAARTPNLGWSDARKMLALSLADEFPRVKGSDFTLHLPKAVTPVDEATEAHCTTAWMDEVASGPLGILLKDRVVGRPALSASKRRAIIE